jgi:hypothetical protein
MKTSNSKSAHSCPKPTELRRGNEHQLKLLRHLKRYQGVETASIIKKRSITKIKPHMKRVTELKLHREATLFTL